MLAQVQVDRQKRAQYVRENHRSDHTLSTADKALRYSDAEIKQKIQQLEMENRRAAIANRKQEIMRGESQ